MLLDNFDTLEDCDAEDLIAKQSGLCDYAVLERF